MPAQPAWFHRLDEILALLRGFDTRCLDRQAPPGNIIKSPSMPARRATNALTTRRACFRSVLK